MGDLTFIAAVDELTRVILYRDEEINQPETRLQGGRINAQVRQLPDGREVRGFVERALVGGAVAEERDRDAARTVHSELSTVEVL